MTSAAPTPPALAPSARFTRELTPTWLTTTTLLAGQRPPDMARIERYVHLGCGDGETAAVVAANHPNTEVWAWDRHAEHLEATQRLADAAGLANLVVHPRRELPADLGGTPADVIVVQDVLTAVDDDQRAQVAAAVSSGLRPGGLVCVTYPTLVSWAEIAPVQALMRQVALAHPGPPEAVVPEVLAVLERLWAGGARYLTERPVVAAWLAGLPGLDPAELSARYLRDPFRPMSPAQVEALVPVGSERIGSARLTDDLDLDLPAPLAGIVTRAVDRVLEETYRDLATRRSHRLDVFRLGRAPLLGADRHERLLRLNLAGLAGVEEPPAVPVDRDAWRQLTSFGVMAGELHTDPSQIARLVRVLMDAGQAHPVVPNGPSRAAREACDALNAVLTEHPLGDRAEEIRAVALLGSAVGIGRTSTMRGIPAGRGVS